MQRGLESRGEATNQVWKVYRCRPGIASRLRDAHTGSSRVRRSPVRRRNRLRSCSHTGPTGTLTEPNLARNLLIPIGTQRGRRESVGRGGTGLATCALREPGVGCRGTSDPFFLPVRDPDAGNDRRLRSAASMAQKKRRDAPFSGRCRRPTGSGTGGIRNSPPGSAILTVIRRIPTQPVIRWLACDHFQRDASGFRGQDRDRILVPALRIDRRAAPFAAAAPPVQDAAVAADAACARRPARRAATAATS